LSFSYPQTVLNFLRDYDLDINSLDIIRGLITNHFKNSIKISYTIEKGIIATVTTYLNEEQFMNNYKQLMIQLENCYLPDPKVLEFIFIKQNRRTK